MITGKVIKIQSLCLDRQSTMTDEETIIADVTLTGKTDNTMTKSVGNAEECKQSCKMLSEALIIQQNMTKLLIKELKQDQDAVVQKVVDKVMTTMSGTMINLTKQTEPLQKSCEEQKAMVNGQLNKFKGKTTIGL